MPQKWGANQGALLVSAPRFATPIQPHPMRFFHARKEIDMSNVQANEAINRERFVLGLLTDETKSCPKEDLMQWWSWRDSQWESLALLVGNENVQESK